MLIARVIGRIEARIRLEDFQAQRFLVLQPLDFELKPIRWTTVAVDVISAREGDVVLFEEGREAANPFTDPILAVDATVVGIVDEFDFEDRHVVAEPM
ncbi:MAG: EutN/CcmL family microcompartment protein [Phycisphaerae bacterium]